MPHDMVRPSLQLRRSYGQLLNQLQDNSEELCNIRDTRVCDVLSDADNLFSDNGEMCASDMALDSALMSGLAGICKRRVFNSTAETLQFRPNEFATRLSFYMMALPVVGGDNNSNNNTSNVCDESVGDCGDRKLSLAGSAVWNRLGHHVNQWWQPAPGLNILLGTLPESAAPAVKPRASRQRAQPVAAVKPDQVCEQQDLESTRREFLRIYNVLRRVHSADEPIPFFRFAYHPTCFATTVENVFHISLLVRDQLVGVFNVGQQLFIEPLAAPSQKSGSSRETRSQQLLMPLTHGDWRRVVETFGIVKPMIPPPKHKR